MRLSRVSALVCVCTFVTFSGSDDIAADEQDPAQLVGQAVSAKSCPGVQQVSTEESMANEPIAKMSTLLKLEPIPQDVWDFKKQFPKSYDSPLHGAVYLAAGQIDPNAPEPLTHVPVFKAFEGTKHSVDQFNVSHLNILRARISLKVRMELGMLFFLYTSEDVSIPGFDIDARYGAVVSYEDDGVRYYELVSCKLDFIPGPNSPVATPGTLDYEVLATVPIG